MQQTEATDMEGSHGLSMKPTKMLLSFLHYSVASFYKTPQVSSALLSSEPEEAGMKQWTINRYPLWGHIEDTQQVRGGDTVLLLEQEMRSHAHTHPVSYPKQYIECCSAYGV